MLQVFSVQESDSPYLQSPGAPVIELSISIENLLTVSRIIDLPEHCPLNSEHSKRLKTACSLLKLFDSFS